MSAKDHKSYQSSKNQQLEKTLEVYISSSIYTWSVFWIVILT
jgi:hypothetical protein